MKTFNFKQNKSVQHALVLALSVSFCALICDIAAAQRGRGGGGGGRGGGGGGGGMAGASQSFNRSPSMSRPTTPSASRPTARPSTSNAARPSTGGAGNQAANRGGAAARPQPAAGQRQPGNAGAGQRQPGNVGQGARPSQGDLNSFLNLSGQNASGARANAATRPAGGNAAVADFFQSGAAAQSAGGGSVAAGRADNIDSRTSERSDFRDQRGEQRDFASDNRQDRVSDRGDRQAARVENRGDFRSSLADGRADNRSERQQELGDQADHIRGELENEFDENHLFEDFWKDHPEAYVNFHQNPVFWTWATVATASAFMPGYPATPAYYDYGTGGNVYYEDDTVHAGDETIPAEEYAQQAADIAASAPKVDNPDDLQWLPLGVFVLSQEGATDAAPNMFLQMAVSKEGIIAGTFQNKTTGETQPVEGMVDQKSQRAAWTLKGKSTPIMETGLANLTQNETSVLVHFADGKTQQWLMAHLEKPADNAKPSE